MPIVDRNVLRLGAYELIWVDSVPDAVCWTRRWRSLRSSPPTSPRRRQRTAGQADGAEALAARDPRLTKARERPGVPPRGARRAFRRSPVVTFGDSPVTQRAHGAAGAGEDAGTRWRRRGSAPRTTEESPWPPGAPRADHAADHNTYTELGAEAGVPALLLFVLMLVFTLQKIRHVRKLPGYQSSDDIRLWTSALWAAMAAYMAGALFSSTEYNLFPYFMVGYISALHRIASVAEDESALGTRLTAHARQNWIDRQERKGTGLEPLYKLRALCEEATLCGSQVGEAFVLEMAACLRVAKAYPNGAPRRCSPHDWDCRSLRAIDCAGKWAGACAFF